MVLTAAGSGSVSVPCRLIWFSLGLLDNFSCSGIRSGLKVRLWRLWCWSLVALVWMGESMGVGLFGLGVVVRISLVDSGTAVARRSSVLWDSSSGCLYWRSRLVFMSVVVLLLVPCCCFMVTRLWWSWIHWRVLGLCISISPGLDCFSRFVSVGREAVLVSLYLRFGSPSWILRLYPLVSSRIIFGKVLVLDLCFCWWIIHCKASVCWRCAVPWF